MIINKFNDIEIICWGELQNKSEIEKICPKIIEGQKEEWLGEDIFFKTYIKESTKKYLLLINDNSKLILPQNYFLKVLQIFSSMPFISFIYSDYNNQLKQYFMPSFKPFVGRNNCFFDHIPLFIDQSCSSLDIINDKKSFLKQYLVLLSENRIGYHIAESVFEIK